MSTAASGLPEDVDPRLWFDTESCGRHYLVEGNPHTFHGRMYAYCEQLGSYTRVSKGEMAESSPEADYFVRGFLSGNEPSPPLSADGDLLPESDPEQQRWQDGVALYRRTGFWRAGDDVQCAACGRVLLRSDPGGDEHCADCRDTEGSAGTR